MYTTVNCARCGTPFQAEIHQIVNVDQNPELKFQLINGQLNMAICPNCGAATQLGTPILYHDSEHELFMVHIPGQMNMDHMQRQQTIGQLTQRLMDQIPQEKRRAYLFQPQEIMTMQTFMEKVLETEGITREMIDKQRRQAELLQRMARADKDVQTHLIEENAALLDDDFFAMLQNFIDTAQQVGDDKQVLPFLNLRAKLMRETEAGRQLEKRQMALHAFNREAKAAGGVSPELLLKHILKNQEDEAFISSLAMMAQPAINYEFFNLLTREIGKQNKAGDKEAVKRLTAVRSQLLQMQEELRKQSEKIASRANETLQAILDAPDREAAVRQHLNQIDDAFMSVLSMRIAQADRQGQTQQAQALHEVYNLIMKQVESQSPPEVQLLNRLITAENESERAQVLDENQSLLSQDMIRLIDAVVQQADQSGQAEMADRLQKVKRMIEARI